MKYLILRKLTQTNQIAMQPFMSLLRCEMARGVCSPVRGERRGGLRVLNVSKTLRKSKYNLNNGTMTAIERDRG